VRSTHHTIFDRMNRIRELTNQPQDDDEVPYGDVHFVQTPFDTVPVTNEVARYIERRMDQPVPPRWLIFRDRHGARIRIRTRDIRSIEQSTERSRAHRRRLQRAYRREEKADRAWDDKDG
jgi:hypothetical protein